MAKNIPVPKNKSMQEFKQLRQRENWQKCASVKTDWRENVEFIGIVGKLQG